MMRSRIMKNRILIALGLIVVLVLSNTAFSFSADNASMPNLERKDSTLAILTQYTDEDVNTPISGMELTAYKVADLSVDGGVAKYTPTNDFKDSGIDFNSLTTSSSIEAAEKLSKLVVEKNITGKDATSNEEGEADFGRVDHGMYLVVQTGANGDAEEYTRLKPFIIMAPHPMTENEDNTWRYDVISIPKMEIVNKTVNIYKTVNSKDSAVVQDSSDKFSYVVLAEINYEPDQFAVVDKVPEELEIVDKKNIEIEVNGKLLDEEVKNEILKIEGNKVRVEPTREQIDEWSPFEIKVLFYCKFKQDLIITEDNVNVTNVAGYEVDKEYFEPKGDENKAVVKAAFENPLKDSAESPEGNGTKTGDEFAMYLRILVLIMTMSAIAIVIILKRRNARTDSQD